MMPYAVLYETLLPQDRTLSPVFWVTCTFLHVNYSRSNAKERKLNLVPFSATSTDVKSLF